MRELAKAISFTARAVGNAGVSMAQFNEQMKKVTKAFDLRRWDNEGDELLPALSLHPHRQYHSNRRSDPG